MPQYEYTSVVLQFEKRAFAATAKDVLQGLSPESAHSLGELGNAGWELVTVLPFAKGLMASTDVALGFFKRMRG